MANRICVKTFPTRTEAETAQARLAASGIESSVSADDASGWQIGISYVTGARLMVRRPDAEQATKILSN